MRPRSPWAIVQCKASATLTRPSSTVQSSGTPSHTVQNPKPSFSHLQCPALYSPTWLLSSCSHCLQDMPAQGPLQGSCWSSEAMFSSSSKETAMCDLWKEALCNQQLPRKGPVCACLSRVRRQQRLTRVTDLWMQGAKKYSWEEMGRGELKHPCSCKCRWTAKHPNTWQLITWLGDLQWL